MHKKIIKYVVSAVLLVIIGVVLFILFQKNPQEIESFKVEDYAYYLENFPSEENVGPIADAKDAEAKAVKIWTKLYGEDVKNQTPYQLFYDEQNHVWFIHGSLPAHMDGGVANILIENDSGDVLAVWHDE